MQDLNDSQSFYLKKPVPKEWSQKMQLLIDANLSYLTTDLVI